MRLDSIPPSKRTVLVVEDERIVARDLQLSLNDLGYRVPVTVASADEAIRAASDTCPDLVLMDMRIKGDVDGIETAHLLRTRFGVPVVYLTAYADDHTLARAKRTEPYGYLLKPIKLEELKSAVEIALYKHATDRRLRDRERWFSTTLRSIGDAVISTDAARHVTFMNPVAETLTGWRADDAKGRPLADVVRLFDERTRAEIENPVGQAMREGGVIRVDASLQRKQGDARHVVDSSSPIVDEAGGLMGAVVVLQDVSDQRQLQQRAELSDRLTSLGTLAAGVAHEINNPLAAVMTNLQVSLSDLERRMRSGADGDRDLYASMSEALQGARRIKDIVADMLAFSRPTTRASQWVELKPAALWALRMTSHELMQRARIVVDIGERQLVAADETRLGQVLVNLLLNAAHAIEEGCPEQNEVRISSRVSGDQGEHIVLEVADTGSGMTLEVLKRMFDPFFTTKEVGRGTGLGLAICHGIVKAWGGTIEADSVVGHGTTFRVTLPVASTVPASSVSLAPPLLPLSVPAADILVIDDEQLVGQAIRRALGDSHRVTLVASGEAAVELFGTGKRFDLVLCDVTMAGMSGLDLLDVTRQADPEQARRFVLMTGGTFTPLAKERLDHATHASLSKPFGPEELTVCVGECLSAWGPIDVIASTG